MVAFFEYKLLLFVCDLFFSFLNVKIEFEYDFRRSIRCYSIFANLFCKFSQPLALNLREKSYVRGHPLENSWSSLQIWTDHQLIDVVGKFLWTCGLGFTLQQWIVVAGYYSHPKFDRSHFSNKFINIFEIYYIMKARCMLNKFIPFFHQNIEI